MVQKVLVSVSAAKVQYTLATGSSENCMRWRGGGGRRGRREGEERWRGGREWEEGGRGGSGREGWEGGRGGMGRREGKERVRGGERRGV